MRHKQMPRLLFWQGCELSLCSDLFANLPRLWRTKFPSLPNQFEETKKETAKTDVILASADRIFGQFSLTQETFTKTLLFKSYQFFKCDSNALRETTFPRFLLESFAFRIIRSRLNCNGGIRG
jgi:hypothetical protein